MPVTKGIEGENTNGLDAQGICSIIEACAKHKITILKFCGLEIWTGIPAVPQPSEPYPVNLNSPAPAHPTNNPDAEISEKTHAELNEKALRENELMLREAQLEEMKISDPLAYEQMVRDGELEDDSDESGEQQ